MQAHQWDEATADPRVKAILTGIIDLIDAVFPDRIRGIYLLGSFAEGTTVTLSDIDLFILFRDNLSTDEGEKFARVVEACGLLCPIRLDISAYSEATFRTEDVRLKLGSVCIAGEDVRAQLPLPTPEEHAQYITNWTNFFVRRLHDSGRLAMTLTYPDSADAFYGYASVRIPEWYPPETALGTKELVATICWVATALLSLMRGAAGFVGTKGEAVRRYEEMGDGEWGGYVAMVYLYCRGAWCYEVPVGMHEREQLRALCAQALSFFNHYLETYAAYLGGQMALVDPVRSKWAEQRWGELLWET